MLYNILKGQQISFEQISILKKWEDKFVLTSIYLKIISSNKTLFFPPKPPQTCFPTEIKVDFKPLMSFLYCNMSFCYECSQCK